MVQYSLILLNTLIIFNITANAWMAYRANSENNEDLVTQLQEYGVIRSNEVALVMQQTDRKHYSPMSPYIDAPQKIGYSATISAPHMHAFALERLRDHLVPGARVLDVGSGSGYLTVCLLRLIRLQGKLRGVQDKTNCRTKVIGVEHFPELVCISKENINADDPDLQNGELLIVEGDGRKGYPEYAPYDAIHVGAASPSMPHELINQLANGGRLLVPIGLRGGEQYMYQIDKDAAGNVKTQKLKSVIFVPLTDLHAEN